MSVQEPSFNVECDRCGEETTADATEYAGQPRTWGVDDSTLEEMGWVVGEGDETYCPKCKDKDDDDE